MKAIPAIRRHCHCDYSQHSSVIPLNLPFHDIHGLSLQGNVMGCALDWSKNVTHLLIDISVLFIQWCWQVLMFIILLSEHNVCWKCWNCTVCTRQLDHLTSENQHNHRAALCNHFRFQTIWIWSAVNRIGFVQPWTSRNRVPGYWTERNYGILPMTPLQTSMLCLHSLVHCITDLQLCKVILDTTLTFEQLSLNYLWWLADIFSNFR